MKGDLIMDSEVQTNESVKARDYSKPILLNLQGEKGLRTYIQIVQSPKIKYDSRKAAEKAKENLRKQGLKIR